MSIGIKIINDWGSLMVDETYSNLYLRQKGSANLAQGHISNPADTPIGGMVDITVTATTPLLAIKSDSYACVFSSVRNSDGTWTFRVISAATSGAISWFLFDIPANAAHSAYGLQVFSAQGIKVFDSGYGYARVATEKTKNDGTLNAETLGLTAGRTYAVVHAAVAYTAGIEAWGQGTIVHWAYLGARGGNGSIDFGGFEAFKHVLIGQDPGSISVPNNTSYKALILDVTNF